MAAALNVCEPMSTGIGGDVFALYWSAADKKVFAVNGSGRSGAELSASAAQRAGVAVLPSGALADATHALTVTVPGACAAWCDVVERFGRLPLGEVLEQAASLAEEGVLVQECAAAGWASAETLLRRQGGHNSSLLLRGHAPKLGERWTNPDLARTLREVGKRGKAAFYEGEIAREIVRAVTERGGVLSMADLASHQSPFEEPIVTEFAGTTVHECAPNGQGLVALIALNIVGEFASLSSAQRTHVMVEALRLAFADARQYIGGSSDSNTIRALLSPQYARERARLISLERAAPTHPAGRPIAASDTVYLCAGDKDGNCCSFINSNYMGFGTGIPVAGFSLQNRGHNFLFIDDKTHPNAVAGGKRPYHTIIPGMLTRGDQLVGAFGVMGGFMQPQGHVQVVLSMLQDHLTPQQAIDALRFCIDGDEVYVEAGHPEAASLAQMGHRVVELSGLRRFLFGRSQIIMRLENGGWVAGSDKRCDGAAVGY